MVWVRGLVRLAGINPISAQIRFLVTKLALNSLIRKVKENTEVFQIPPIPFVKGGNLMKSLKNLPPFVKGDRGGFRRAKRLLHGIESSEVVSRQQFMKYPG